jgi:hypothetical protein
LRTDENRSSGGGEKPKLGAKANLRPTTRGPSTEMVWRKNPDWTARTGRKTDRKPKDPRAWRQKIKNEQ